MRGQRKLFWLLFGIGFLLSVSGVEASVIINEIFADPPPGLIGDSNLDGVRSSSGDEFVEILNFGADEVDISNWFLTDKVSTRHVFPFNSVISPYSFFVVFGGGNPALSGIDWQVASSGKLGLNNSSDIVTLFDFEGNMVDQVSYGSIANKNQSITLFPDGEGSEFFLHSDLELAQGNLFSPGATLDGKLSLTVLFDGEGADNSVVPEFPTLAYFIFGWVPFLFRRKWAC